MTQPKTILFAPINLPAGYECTLETARVEGCILKWLVPGGDPVYVATVTPTYDEAFWTDMLAHVQAFTNGERKPRQISPIMAILPKLPEGYDARIVRSVIEGVITKTGAVQTSSGGSAEGASAVEGG